MFQKRIDGEWVAVSTSKIMKGDCYRLVDCRGIHGSEGIEYIAEKDFFTESAYADMSDLKEISSKVVETEDVGHEELVSRVEGMMMDKLGKTLPESVKMRSVMIADMWALLGEEFALEVMDDVIRGRI